MSIADKLSFSIEPQKGGKLHYLQLAPAQAGKPRSCVIAFRVNVVNDNTNDKDQVTLKQIKVSFPGSGLESKSFGREMVVAPGGSSTTYLQWDKKKNLETISIPVPQQGSQIQIDLLFKEFADVLTTKMELVPHKNPTSEGSYNFIGRPQDMNADEYFAFDEHIGGGSQHFGYDIGAIGWNAHYGKFMSFSGEHGDTNESHFAFHKPIYALGDGIVLNAVSGYPNNPKPGWNFVLRTGDVSAGAITHVDIAELQKLGDTATANARMLAAVRSAEGRLKLIVFEQSADGKEVKRLGDSEGQQIPEASGSEVSVCVMNKNRAVTAVTSKGAFTLTLWSISDDAKQISTVDTLTIPQITSAKMGRLSSTRIIIASRTAAGTFSLAVWKISGNPLNKFDVKPMGQATAGQVGVFDIAVLSQSRVVSAVQTSSGKLKVVVWDLALTNSNTVQTITRRGDTGEVEPVSAIALSGTSESNQVAAAVRNAGGNLKIFYWDIDAGGVIKETAQTEAGTASLVSITRFKKTALLTAVRGGDNTLRLILWNLKDDNGTKTIKRQGEAEAGVVGAISLGLIDTYHPTVASAVRDGAGNLKVVLWQISTHNGYRILHGDDVRGHEVVGYWHMSDINQQLLKPGTKVKAGQYLGRLGNSGASGGPHLHIDAVKVNVKVNGGPIDDLKSNDKNGAPTLTLAQLIEMVADGTWSDPPFDVPYRPLVFHNARAMVASGLKKGGVWKNPFGVLNDDGIYFDQYAIFPGPSTEPAECGGIDKQLAELNSEIDDLQNQLGEEVGQAKVGIANQIKALRKQVEELKAHGIGIGCKI